MAHERIEINLPLAKVYELLNDPVDFPKFLERIEEVEKINSQTFKFKTHIDDELFEWTTNIIDDLRNTRFAWITINGSLNQTGTIRFTPMDNGERTMVDFSLDYRTFFGEPGEGLAEFIESLEAQLSKDLVKLKELAEAKKFDEAPASEAEAKEKEEVKEDQVTA